MLVPPVAARQRGVFSRRQARAAGISAKVIRSRLRSGLWREVVPNAFALSTAPDSVALRAQAAVLVTPGVASHETAALLHGLALPWEADRDVVHVVMRPRVHDQVPGVVVHRLPLAADEQTEVDGIAVTTRLRTVIDLLAWTDAGRARTLLFRCVQDRLLDQETLRAQAVRRSGMHGTPQLRELADLLGTGAHSVAEKELHRLLEQVDGLRWSANARLSVAGRTFVVDVLLPDHGVVVEVDGRRYHGGEVFERDRERQNLLVGAGFTVLRFTWLDVVERPGYVVDRVVTQLRAA